MSFDSVRFVGSEVLWSWIWNYYQVNMQVFFKKKHKALPFGLLGSKGSKTAQLDGAGNGPLLFLTYSLASTSGEYLSSIC